MYLAGNLLDSSEGSEDLENIQALIDRGATVHYDPILGSLPAGLFSVAGQVIAVDVDYNSFTVHDQELGRSFVVRVGVSTGFIRLVLPVSPVDPPDGSEAFVPVMMPATVQDLQADDHVFVRSSHELKEGESVVDPLEIQVLP